MYLVVSKARPGIVQTVNPPRQLLLADAIRAATGYLFYTTATACRPGDPLPADAVAFYGEAVATVDKAGAVTIGGGTVSQSVRTMRAGVFATGKCDASGNATVVFSPPFSDVPLVEQTIQMVGAVMVVAVPLSATAAGCTVTLMRSKTSVLVGSPCYEPAPAGTAGAVKATGY